MNPPAFTPAVQAALNVVIGHGRKDPTIARRFILALSGEIPSANSIAIGLKVMIDDRDVEIAEWIKNFNEMSAVNAEMTATNAKLDAMNDKLDATNDKLTEKHHKLREKYDTVKKALNEMTETLFKRENTIDELDEVLGEIKKDSDGTTLENSALKDSFAAKCEEAEYWREFVIERNVKVRDLENSLARCDDIIRDLRRLLADRNAEIGNLSNLLAKQTEKGKNSDRITLENSALKSQREDLMTQNKKQAEIITQLEQKIHEAKERNNQLEKAFGTISALSGSFLEKK